MTHGKYFPPVGTTSLLVTYKKDGDGPGVFTATLRHFISREPLLEGVAGSGSTPEEAIARLVRLVEEKCEHYRRACDAFELEKRRPAEPAGEIEWRWGFKANDRPHLQADAALASVTDACGEVS